LHSIGISDALIFHFAGLSAKAKAELKSIGAELKWPSNRLVPSVLFLARETGSEDLYRFIYHATSRFVHFSVQELGRRGWYDSNLRMTIGSKTFSYYWKWFSLRYGAELFLFTLTIALELLDKAGDLDYDAASELVEVLSNFNLPLITAEELNQ